MRLNAPLLLRTAKPGSCLPRSIRYRPAPLSSSKGNAGAIRNCSKTITTPSSTSAPQRQTARPHPIRLPPLDRRQFRPLLGRKMTRRRWASSPTRARLPPPPRRLPPRNPGLLRRFSLPRRSRHRYLHPTISRHRRSRMRHPRRVPSPHSSRWGSVAKVRWTHSSDMARPSNPRSQPSSLARTHSRLPDCQTRHRHLTPAKFEP
jgi:hypothetical protein